ncbi:DUF1934 domain-containing protein [Staphylococcus massiliensis]|uniref:DUF1934 domain-containing protein n=1 Tax=Staphylococcus massiliensis S46 TaxID=1229783 RepID=K9AWY1_9STAP|nr:DUF1934 family protein [Staphylococcus massiliensis]EKU46020.1 hypothetical protein C273_10177 [Staphylococcus massiliensis S46]PNZ98007.1 DUF1934 domain-containing protein [Staphylococcus massiliensis CCUG 55927]
MDNNVIIHTHQIVEQGNDTDRFDTTTKGVWKQKQAEFIRYVETVEQNRVNVTVKVEDNGVKIIRKGDINMRLHFVEGEDTITFYELPTGRIPLTVHTKSIITFQEAHGGQVKVNYDLYQENEIMGSYQYEIKYKEI